MTLTNLRTLRQEQALSMRDLAQRARVSPATILRAEQGLPIYPTSIRKLAKALGVTPAALRGIEPSPESPPPATPRRAATAPLSPLDRRLELAHARAEAQRARRDGNEAEAERWEQIAAGIAAAVAESSS